MTKVYGGGRAKHTLLTRSRIQFVIKSDKEMTTDVYSYYEQTHVCKSGIINIINNYYYTTTTLKLYANQQKYV